MPRNVSGRKLARALERLGYEQTTQKGSHMRLVTHQNGRNRVIVTDEPAIPVGTPHSILRYVAGHFRISIAELLDRLELK